MDIRRRALSNGVLQGQRYEDGFRRRLLVKGAHRRQDSSQEAVYPQNRMCPRSRKPRKRQCRNHKLAPLRKDGQIVSRCLIRPPHEHRGGAKQRSAK